MTRRADDGVKGVEQMPLWLLIVIFVAAAAVIWVAGIRLATTTNALDERWHLGSALGGLLVLAVATNLPEIAITVSAAVSGHLDVAVGNILGGIAMQTLVLVVLDAVGGRTRGPLTYRAASLVLVLEAVTVVAILALVVAGSQLPGGVALGGVSPEGVLILALWIAGLLIVRAASHHLPWQADGIPEGSTSQNGPHRSHPSPHHERPTWRIVVTFAIAAAATLVAGVVLELAGDAAADQLGLSGVLFGATFLALATSLPELSTGLQAVRSGEDHLAVSDILGGNAFLPVLFLVASIISGQPALPRAESTDIYLTALAALLTLVYAVGFILRSRRRVVGIGVDSFVVVVLYAAGIAGLFAIAS